MLKIVVNLFFYRVENYFGWMGHWSLFGCWEKWGKMGHVGSGTQGVKVRSSTEMDCTKWPVWCMLFKWRLSHLIIRYNKTLLWLEMSIAFVNLIWVPLPILGLINYINSLFQFINSPLSTSSVPLQCCVVSSSPGRSNRLQLFFLPPWHLPTLVLQKISAPCTNIRRRLASELTSSLSHNCRVPLWSSLVAVYGCFVFSFQHSYKFFIALNIIGLKWTALLKRKCRGLKNSLTAAWNQIFFMPLLNGIPSIPTPAVQLHFIYCPSFIYQSK